MREKVRELREKGLTVYQISITLGCTKSTVSYHLNKLGLKTTYKTTLENPELLIKRYQELKNLKKVAQEFEISYNTARKICKEFNIEVKKHKQVSKSEAVMSWRQRKKIELVEYKGGCCQVCGYNKSFRALAFHHIDPRDKDFQISGKSKNKDLLYKEVNKCVLVCHNCHSEIHDEIYIKGYSDMVNNIINNNNTK